MEADAARIRAEVVSPFIAQATADGTAFVAAGRGMGDVPHPGQRAPILRRAAIRVADATNVERESAEDVARRRRGSSPQSTTGLASWADAVARKTSRPTRA